jgi:hypothetical protein
MAVASKMFLMAHIWLKMTGNIISFLISSALSFLLSLGEHNCRFIHEGNALASLRLGSVDCIWSLTAEHDSMMTFLYYRLPHHCSF